LESNRSKPSPKSNESLSGPLGSSNFAIGFEAWFLVLFQAAT